MNIQPFLIICIVLFLFVFISSVSAIESDYLWLLRNGKIVDAVEQHWNVPRALEFHYGSLYTNLSEKDQLKCVQLYSEFLPIYISNHFRFEKEPSEYIIVETNMKLKKQYNDITEQIYENNPQNSHLVILLQKDGKSKIVDQWKNGISVSMSIMGLVDSHPDELLPLPEYIEELIGMIWDD